VLSGKHDEYDGALVTMDAEFIKIKAIGENLAIVTVIELNKQIDICFETETMRFSF